MMDSQAQPTRARRSGRIGHAVTRCGMWALFAAVVFALAATVVSRWWWSCLRDTRTTNFIHLGGGQFCICHDDRQPWPALDTADWELLVWKADPPSLSLWFASLHDRGNWVIGIPLWLFAVLFALPAAHLF